MIVRIPKSKKSKDSTDPLKMLRIEVKDITKIQPLALRGEITTWQYDAKNCIRIFYRMFDNNLYSKKLFNACKNWAKRLLFYSKFLGFEDEYPASILCGRPTIVQGHWWLTSNLKEIVELKWKDLNVKGFYVERKIDDYGHYKYSIYESSYPVNYLKRRCGLTNNFLSKFKNIVRYKSEVDGVKKVSSFIGDESLNKLIIKINKAVKKHRNPEYRSKILDKMRSKNYAGAKLRAGIRKA